MSKPRRFRFSLRTLFVLVTVVAVAIWAYPDWRIARERRQLLRAVPPIAIGLPFKDSQGELKTPKLSWLRRSLGDEPTFEIEILGGTQDEWDRIRRAFPESRLRLGAHVNRPNLQ